MCFAHSSTASEALHIQAEIGSEAAAAFSGLVDAGALGTVDLRCPKPASRRPRFHRAGH
ncbi:hypothetical protein EV137_4643 [Kribbella pratensis]|uniref:Uncharacterized protein n=1 Tax=Kribbella pratensis TaxID=2512112 RepID=A0ABY2FHG1_9ACTN|nr:hypothetical protein EV137_4643 [Kribbella pratensis]TDW98570.1 hypothetical protein EV647_3292 [Kribbella sp. VKM Ac-2566]